MKDSDVKFDVVVVGSDPSGVHAAYPLIEAGLKVARRIGKYVLKKIQND